MRRSKENYEFKDALELNNATFNDYLNRFKRIALSMFEWVNLPSSMDPENLLASFPGCWNQVPQTRGLEIRAGDTLTAWKSGV